MQGYLEMLETVRDRMSRLIAEEKSLDEIIELKPNADYDDALGKGFINPEQFSTKPAQRPGAVTQLPNPRNQACL